MAQTAANLVDHVLPPSVALRQFVLTVPFELRARLAYDSELLGGVSRELATAVQDFYRRRFEQVGVRGGKTGSVTVVQRSNSDLRLNPHYHQIALDGVYTAEDDEAIPEFHPLAYLTSEDVADLLQLARVRILRFLKRQGAIVETRPLEVSDAGLANGEEGLQQLAAAGVPSPFPEPQPVDVRGIEAAIIRAADHLDVAPRRVRATLRDITAAVATAGGTLDDLVRAAQEDSLLFDGDERSRGGQIVASNGSSSTWSRRTGFCVSSSVIVAVN